MRASPPLRAPLLGRLSAAARKRAPELLLTAVFVALVTPVIVSGGAGTAGAVDERGFHLPTALKIGYELPTPDLVNIPTATTPGYHLVLSVFARLLTPERAALEAFGATFSLAMVLVAFWLMCRYVDRWLALALTLPILLSHYVLQSAAWINTDNAAMLFILLAIGLSLRLQESGRGFATGGAFVFLAIWVRQLALWVAGPFAFAAALAGGLIPGFAPAAGGRRSLRPVVLAGAALIPALASLAALFAAWGQTTPPTVQQGGFSPAAAPFTLGLVGIFGAFFAVPVVDRSDLLRGRAPRVAAAAALAFALAVPTSESAELEGRRTGGGLWKLVDLGPVVADRSLVIAVLAPAGAVLLVALWRAAERAAMTRPALVLMVVLASLVLAQTSTNRTYQRYFEPTVLAVLALLAAIVLAGRGGAAREGPARRRALAAMAALSVLQLAGCVTVVYSNAL
ncbi:MAG TPA: hypothetical protein VF712_04785 [Thermoleophilaceae bacterium]